MSNNKHVWEVWEGWTVQSFIDELEPTFKMIMNNQSHRKPFKTKEEIKEWCKDNQQHIPDVYKYFVTQANI